MAIAKGDDLVALDVFVPAEANVVATLLGHSRGAVAVNHRCVEQFVLKQRSHRIREDSIDTAVNYPATKDSVDARVMDFCQPICVLFNGQHLPLAPQVELQQNVVENLVQRQFDMRPSASAREVGQDKFLKLLNTQIRWNPLPLLAFRHFDRQSGRILPYMVDIAQTQRSCGLADNSIFKKTRNQLEAIATTLPVMAASWGWHRTTPEKYPRQVRKSRKIFGCTATLRNSTASVFGSMRRQCVCCGFNTHSTPLFRVAAQSNGIFSPPFAERASQF